MRPHPLAVRYTVVVLLASLAVLLPLSACVRVRVPWHSPPPMRSHA